MPKGAAGTESGAMEAGTATSTSRSVRRALDILELMLARVEPLSVAELVRLLRIPKSTAYELVRTLAQAGYIERATAAGAYGLGRKLFELGMAYRSQVDLLKEGGQIVEELRDETGETVQLSVLEHDMMLVLVKEESPQPIRIISRVGSRVPVNWAAAGRLLVSDLDDDTLRALLKSIVRPSPTGRAPTDIDDLVMQIRKFRKQGYAVELNEANEHAGCVAAPVIDATGDCVAAVSIVAPEQRLQKKQRETLIAAVKAAANKLSHRLGG
ncbi:IclR family transcriptional regulator [Rhodospirillaceae bacterium SYSU D60014]|uniref:IclR family transcriptional regulator n=1 Tax=Virgifigura deserti TaxID=2268457 RepID=UPI0013C40DCB